MNKSYLIVIIALAILYGCKEENREEFTDTPIIESYIEPNKTAKIKISRQIPFSSDITYSSDELSELDVTVIYNNEVTYVFVPSDSNGLYVNNDIEVKDGDQLELTFNYNSKEVSAYTYIPAKPTGFTQSDSIMYIEKLDTSLGPPSGGFDDQPDPIELNWDNPDNSHYLILVENLESAPEAIRDFGDDEPPGNIFRKSPTLSSSEEITSREFQYFGRHRIVIYHVLPDYATLYDDNSTSSQNLTNPSTSITNGYGIFTGLNSDTLYVKVFEK